MSDVVLKPTVVIGLGGSGCETVLNLKARIVEAFGRIPPTLAFLVFDTTQNPNAVRRTSSGEDVVLGQGEFVKMTVENPQRFIQTNPGIKAWFPSGLDTQAIVAGAGMVRARGRLAFFFRFLQCQQAISDAKNRVRLLDHHARTQPEGESFAVADATDVNVFICSSICGGTGAGAFIDAAWLARDGLSSGQVNGVLFLPRIFKANVKPSQLMLKNAYSAFKELDHWMSGRAPGVIDYGAARVNVTRPPFDLVYLLDGINRNGKIISDLPQLYQFASEALFLMIGSQVGQAGAGTLDNVFTNMSTRATVKGKKAIYCSFGVGKLSYPVRHARTLAAAKEAVRLGREDLLNGLASEAQLEADVHSFIVRTGLLEDGGNQVVNALVRMTDGGTFTPVVNLEDVDADRAAPTNARQYAEHRQNALTSELQRHIERNAQELLGRTLAAFDSHFAQALQSRSNGLSYSLNFVTKLQARLDTWRLRLIGEANEVGTRLERVNVAGALAAIEQASKRMLLNQHHLRNAIADYAAEVTSECELRLEIERRTRAAQLFARMSESLKELTQKLETARAVCRAVVDDMERRLDQALQQRPDAGFERYVHVAEPPPGTLATSAVEFLSRTDGRMIDWTFRDRERVGAELWNYVDEHVRKVVTPRLESVSTPAALATQLHELNSVSTPLWQYERAELPGNAADMMTFYVYGVESAAETLLRQAELTSRLPAGQGKATIVSTNDPETIYQLQIEAGLPLFALKDLTRWKEEYDDPERLTGHVMEGAKQFSEVLSDIGTTEAMRAFALAVSDVFAIIDQASTGGLTTSEITYSLSRKRGLRDEVISLGEGRLVAFRRFAADESLVQHVALQIQQQLAARSTADTIEGLQKYYRALDERMRTANWPFQVKVHIEQELNTINDYVESLNTIRV